MTVAHSQPSSRWSLDALFKRLGPGVITGAADDDPSGIATCSQVGAREGFGLLWTVVLTLPLMVAVQSIRARIGCVTGRGLAGNMVKVFPRSVVMLLVLLLFVANTINLGADLAAMGAAAKLVVGGNARLYTLAFAVLSLLAIVFVPSPSRTKLPRERFGPVALKGHGGMAGECPHSGGKPRAP